MERTVSVTVKFLFPMAVPLTSKPLGLVSKFGKRYLVIVGETADQPRLQGQTTCFAGATTLHPGKNIC